MPGAAVADMIWLGRGFSSLEQRGVVGDSRQRQTHRHTDTQAHKGWVQVGIQRGDSDQRPENKMQSGGCSSDKGKEDWRELEVHHSAGKTIEAREMDHGGSVMSWAARVPLQSSRGHSDPVAQLGFGQGGMLVKGAHVI